MSRQLPPRAHLGQLKHQAKDISRAHAKRDAGVCEFLRALRRFQRSTDEEILAAELSLNEVQYALALDYGFTSWDALKRAATSDESTESSLLVREGGAKYIRHFENACWGGPHEKQNSVIAAMELALSTFGEKSDYETLMGLSGAAFRLQHKWCPSSPHAKCGFDCAGLAARTAGYTLHWLTAKDVRVGNWQYTKELATAHTEATSAIDQGHAVLWGSEECGLLVGYADTGEWLLRPYAPDATGYARSDDWPWYFGVFAKSGSPLEGIERAVHALVTAVTLARTPSFDGYTSGFEAYERWANELEANALFDDSSTWFQTALGNAHTYSCLAEARGVAAGFLERLARELPESVKPSLLRAAREYGDIAALIKQGQLGAPEPRQLFPWVLGAPERWTEEQRLAQARTLRAARAKELQAIGAIEEALLALGISGVLAQERSG